MKAEDGEYEVECILDERQDSGKEVEYFVKWKHFPDSYNTWEPASNMKTAKELISQFKRRIERQARYERLKKLKEMKVPVDANNKSKRIRKSFDQEPEITNYQCEVCFRYFRAPQGLARHAKGCGVPKKLRGPRMEKKEEKKEELILRLKMTKNLLQEYKASRRLQDMKYITQSSKTRGRKRKTTVDLMAMECIEVECPACQGKHRAHICSKRKSPMIHIGGNVYMAKRSESIPLFPTDIQLQTLIKEAKRENHDKEDSESDATNIEGEDRDPETIGAAFKELALQQIYPVEKILEKRTKDEKTTYLLNWKLCNSQWNSWEPAENILSAKLIQDYNKSHPEMFEAMEAEVVTSKFGRGRVKRRYHACADCGSRHSGWGASRWVGMEKYGRPLCVRCYDRYRKAEQQARIRTVGGVKSRRIIVRKLGSRNDKKKGYSDEKSDIDSLDEHGADLDPSFPLSPSSDEGINWENACDEKILEVRSRSKSTSRSAVSLARSSVGSTAGNTELSYLTAEKALEELFDSYKLELSNLRKECNKFKDKYEMAQNKLSKVNMKLQILKNEVTSSDVYKPIRVSIEECAKVLEDKKTRDVQDASKTTEQKGDKSQCNDKKLTDANVPKFPTSNDVRHENIVLQRSFEIPLSPTAKSSRSGSNVFNNAVGDEKVQASVSLSSKLDRKQQPGSIQIVYPVGREVFDSGSSFTMRWIHNGNAGDYVSLKLYRIFQADNGLEDEVVESSIGSFVKIDRGQYKVTLPSNMRFDGKFRLEVTCQSNPIICGYSGIFTIKGKASILSNNYGGGRTR